MALSVDRYLTKMVQEARAECVQSHFVNVTLGCSGIPTEIYSITAVEEAANYSPKASFLQSKRAGAGTRFATLHIL